MMATFREEVASFRQRLAEAKATRDAWRDAGDRERYLHAYFDVEGMELLLDQRLRQHGAGLPEL